MDRREFFRRGLNKATKVAIEEVDARLRERASHWIRPPYALSEFEFLLACNRCGECVNACPHDVIFPLSQRLGVQVANTPALDLLNKGCQLCKDWPCVQSCETGALRLPEQQGEDAQRIQLASVSINVDRCLPYFGPECGACRGSCPVDGALTWDAERPVVDESLCSGCAQCREVCIVEPKAIEVRSLQHQNFAADSNKEQV